VKSKKRTNQEVSQVMSWNTLEIEITSAHKGCKSWLDYMSNLIPGWQATLWPCPRPFPKVRNGAWSRETMICTGALDLYFY